MKTNGIIFSCTTKDTISMSFIAKQLLILTNLVMLNAFCYYYVTCKSYKRKAGSLAAKLIPRIVLDRAKGKLWEMCD